MGQGTSTPKAPATGDVAWAEARRRLAGLPGGGLNIAFEALDRHVADGNGQRVAMRWLPKKGTAVEYSYRDLVEATNRFANVLSGLGIGPGDRVFALLGRIPELYVAALGTLKHRAVFCPLFSAFGPRANPPADEHR